MAFEVAKFLRSSKDFSVLFLSLHQQACLFLSQNARSHSFEISCVYHEKVTILLYHLLLILVTFLSDLVNIIILTNVRKTKKVYPKKYNYINHIHKILSVVIICCHNLSSFSLNCFSLTSFTCHL